MTPFFASLLTSLAVVGGVAVGLFVFLPLLLALWETLKRGGSNSSSRFSKSKLCVGQVWHTRFHPKRHSFSYPIFMFALDLEESFGNFLSPMVRFQPSQHHLKNGEGKATAGDKDSNKSSSSKSGDDDDDNDEDLAQRILNLVATKTNHKFQPTLKTHQIILLTHLEYFGYNFNPVSFYYLVHKSTHTLEAMVGEVSNTPWTEMYCYVLHPDSVDQVQCQEKEARAKVQQQHQKQQQQQLQQLDYRFPKAFHVSPFMEMEYWYDWSFQGIPGQNDEFVVINSLRRRKKDDETMDFTAKLKMTTVDITPWAVAWQMIRFPIFCMLIQIWIHYQAAWLFLKGVVYVPHPQGSETAASKTIATIMTPFFAIRDYYNANGVVAAAVVHPTNKSRATKED